MHECINDGMGEAHDTLVGAVILNQLEHVNGCGGWGLLVLAWRIDDGQFLRPAQELLVHQGP